MIGVCPTHVNNEALTLGIELEMCCLNDRPECHLQCHACTLVQHTGLQQHNVIQTYVQRATFSTTWLQPLHEFSDCCQHHVVRSSVWTTAWRGLTCSVSWEGLHDSFLSSGVFVKLIDLSNLFLQWLHGKFETNTIHEITVCFERSN